MPRVIAGRSVATEKELLKFANAVRVAGGAEVIEALLPSTPRSPGSCLIANALNFGCKVDTGKLGYYPHTAAQSAGDGYVPTRDQIWHMEFPETFTKERVAAIASKVPGAKMRVKDEEWCEIDPVMQLPRHIGNAAGAFDAGQAFQEFREGYEGDA